MGEEIIAQRVFNTAYIWIDTCFILFLCAMLIVKKKYLTLIWSLFGGVLYMAVDYGIFHLLTHSRSIYLNGAEGSEWLMFGVLLWMSFSYGITNFAWIWLWISKDKRLLEWSLIICVWWISAPLIASIFHNAPLIKIQRTTGAYHGVMGIILFAGYAFAFVYNLMLKDKKYTFPLIWLLAIGVLVQFAWEFSLLAGGIRSAEIGSWSSKLKTLVVNSLVETNLGAVPIYCIYIAVTAKFTERLKKRQSPVSFKERLAEMNLIKVREGQEEVA